MHSLSVKQVSIWLIIKNRRLIIGRQACRMYHHKNLYNMADLQDTARCGKTETLNDVLIRLGYLNPKNQPHTQEQILVAILSRIQRMHVGLYTLMSEHWDWLVVLQCMQDYNLFKSNPKRPPLAAFDQWLHEHDVPQLLAHCSVREMSYANTGIRGARYPWADVHWEPHVLDRWRVLYRTLGKLLSEMQAE